MAERYIPVELPAELIDETTRTINRIGTELMFTPASQPRVTIRVDELTLIIKAARDGLVAHVLSEALVQAEEELTETGAIADMPLITRALSLYRQNQPPTKDQ